MRALAVPLVVLLAGCAGPADEPLDGAALEPGGECGRFLFTVAPAEIRPGEDATFTVRVENCGTAPIERSTPCASPNAEPRIDVDGDEWRIVNGSAASDLLCLTMIGQWSAPVGGAFEQTFRWNGTLRRCSEASDGRFACRDEDAPPGAYVARAALDQLAGDARPRYAGETRVVLAAR